MDKEPEEWVKIREDQYHQTWLHKDHGERLINTELLNFITKDLLSKEREKNAKEQYDYWVNIFDSKPVREKELESDNTVRNIARIETERWLEIRISLKTK